MPRAALAVIVTGAVAAVLVAAPWTVFDLDRFLVPKELVLHLTAVIAGLLTLRRMRPDRLLTIFLILSALSAILAQNKWLGFRALAISVSSVLLFWAARTLDERPLVNGLAIAVIVAAITSLLQAYGLDLIWFATTRVPGGTLGNRNFVAHMAAFGLPLCMLAALRAWRYAPGVAVVAAALVLSRSRAGWLAAAAALLVFCIFSLREKRLYALLAIAAAGAAAALILPNALHWRSRNPYVETMSNVADYESGSGRGRLVQYQRSLRMAAQHALLGVGPGNWAVDYPRHAARNDPSLSDSEAGMTSNPWPSSDWVAFIAERGLIAAVVLALALFSLVRRNAALLATLIAVGVAGLFDAVLLLPAPALIAWSAFGALCGERLQPVPPEPSSRLKPAAIVAILVALIGAARSAAQLVAMDVYATRSDRPSLERAARIDPSNYRLQLRLAHGGRARCEHARAAHALYPSAEAAAEAARDCKK
jgi:O-antigen ligase